MRHIIKVPASRENETLGYSYILPQAGVYTTPNNPGVVFSSVSVDRSQANHALVTSEFRERAVGGRIFRWKINKATGLLGPTAVALGAWRATDVPSIQGALMKGGRIGLSSSFSTAPGPVGERSRREPALPPLWPTGAEDVTYAVSGRVYSLDGVRREPQGVRGDGGRPRPVAAGLRPRGGSRHSRWPPRCARRPPRPS